MSPNTQPQESYSQILELQKQNRDLRIKLGQERAASAYLSGMPAIHSLDSSVFGPWAVSTDSTTTNQAMKSGKKRKYVTDLTPTKVCKCALELTLRSQVTLRSFSIEINWGGLAVVAYLRVPLSSKIQLPKSSMTLWDLVRWLTDRIDGNNGHGATEERAALQNISGWAARIYDNLDADDTQRRIFLVSLIGRQVKLESGAYTRLIGMRGDEFIVQDTEGAEYIVGKHVELESVQPHASV
ncbi:hypothetical protein EJ07DRAFT_142722 [Lizonia empirigonia]|nr:hypothetical protein EJ07DRAFT_142722 [Lizonia empirigonia]